METRPHLKSPSRRLKETRPAAVVSTYTCPRCRARNKAIGCLFCGWTPDTSVAYAGADASREDRIISC